MLDWIRNNFRRAVLIFCGATLGFLTLVGSTIILNGFILGGLLVAGGLALFVKLPKPVQRFALQHPLMLDVTLSVLAFVITGTGTVTGLIAGGVTGLVVSFIILLAAEFNLAALV